MLLIDIPIGQTAIITAIRGPQTYIERLAELGFHGGTTICLCGRAPWGGPLIVQVGHSYVAVRAKEAECIQIEPVS